jgi:hypothetical protein
MIPKAPCCRVIREGTIGTCPECGSTEDRKYNFLFFSFGKKIGCINECCHNYKFNKQRIRKYKLKKLNKCKK